MKLGKMWAMVLQTRERGSKCSWLDKNWTPWYQPGSMENNNQEDQTNSREDDSYQHCEPWCLLQWNKQICIKVKSLYCAHVLGFFQQVWVWTALAACLWNKLLQSGEGRNKEQKFSPCENLQGLPLPENKEPRTEHLPLPLASGRSSQLPAAQLPVSNMRHWAVKIPLIGRSTDKVCLNYYAGTINEYKGIKTLLVIKTVGHSSVTRK